MDLRPTEDQRAMAQMVEKMLDDHCPPEALRRAGGFDAARWQVLQELGLAGMLVPEADGGLGLAMPDFLPIAALCGAALLPEPLVDQVGVVQPLLAEAGASGALERALGGAVIALLHPLDPYPNHGASAEAALIPGADGLRLVEAADLKITDQPSIDPLRRPASLAAAPGAGALIAGPDETPGLLARAAARGAIGAAAQLLGLARKVTELACAYAAERQQFGKPIGTNQALKHLLANAEVARAFAAPVLAAAAHACPGTDAHSAARIGHAKIAAGRAADLAARSAVQVHGAMGYSWEVDVHFYLKRALALRALWGGKAHHEAHIHARLAEHATAPDTLFGDPDA